MAQNDPKVANFFLSESVCCLRLRYLHHYAIHICENMSREAYRCHLAIICSIRLLKPYISLFFTTSKNGVWTFDEVNMPL